MGRAPSLKATPLFTRAGSKMGGDMTFFQRENALSVSSTNEHFPHTLLPDRDYILNSSYSTACLCERILLYCKHIVIYSSYKLGHDIRMPGFPHWIGTIVLHPLPECVFVACQKKMSPPIFDPARVVISGCSSLTLYPVSHERNIETEWKVDVPNNLNN